MKVHNQKVAVKQKMLRSEIHDKIHASSPQVPIKSERCITNKTYISHHERRQKRSSHLKDGPVIHYRTKRNNHQPVTKNPLIQ